MRIGAGKGSGWGVLAMVLAASGCASKAGSIGAMLGQNHETGRVTVRSVPEDMEAWKAGVLEDDELLLIDGVDVRRMTPEQVHEALAGPQGSYVSLTLLRNRQILRVKVRRGPLKNTPKRQGASP